jgi:4-hydroxybenzoate polyprenyltransferase
MKNIINGLLRLLVASYIVLGLILSDYRLNFDAPTKAEQIGLLIGTIVGFYFLLAFWVHQMIQGIKDLQQKRLKKIKFITISSIIATILLIITHLNSMIQSTITYGYWLSIVFYIIQLSIFVYVLILDFKLIRKKNKTLPNT